MEQNLQHEPHTWLRAPPDPQTLIFLDLSDLIWVEMPPSSKAVLTGVAHGMNVEAMQASLQSSNPSVDPYMGSQASN